MTARQENLGQSRSRQDPMLQAAANVPCNGQRPPARLIAGLEFGEEDVLAAVRRNGLLSIELEMTRLCNLRCLYCYSQAGPALPDEMDLPEMEDVIGIQDEHIALVRQAIEHRLNSP